MAASSFFELDLLNMISKFIYKEEKTLRNDLRWKVGLIFGLVIIAGLILGFGQGFFKSDPLRLGLDLKGGIELLLEADYRLGPNQLTELGNQITLKMKQAGIAEPQVQFLGTPENNLYEGLQLTFANAAVIQQAQNINAFPATYKLEAFGETKNLQFTPVVKGNIVELKVIQDPHDYPADALERSQAIVENRISDQSSGMAEAEVRLDQNNRLNVQLPGISSLQQARDLITATGRLTFRIDNRTVLDGTDLKDISTNYQAGTGYVINFTFKGDGSRQLEKVTTDNVGKIMAVYLDETKLIDPTIKTPIPDGSGQIELPGTPKEEVDRYALLMKSGALPISLKVVQANQVAPTLGKEIVQEGIIGGIAGIILVILFMIMFYSLPGLLADVALVFYAILVLGVMALLRGVLTLPGIAGFILSLGMAVDANVIIFERIKDELRNGKRVRAAVEAGYHRALTAIIDSNVTTLIAAGVLYFFGTGSVKGFAVTLSIGIMVSMFTAIFVTKAFVEWKIDQDPDRHAKYFGFKEVQG